MVGLPKVSLATTVITMVWDEGSVTLSVIVAAQYAVLAPLAVSLPAVTPLTVTDETPLLPRPLSLAVPLTVRLVLVTVAPLTGELTIIAGPCVSGV